MCLLLIVSQIWAAPAHEPAVRVCRKVVALCDSRNIEVDPDHTAVLVDAPEK
jgi:hypothetical protein